VIRSEPPPEAHAIIAVVEQFLRQANRLLAYNAVQDGLGFGPAIFACGNSGAWPVARSGDTARANELLCELAAEGVADAQTLGMLARTHKDLALASQSAADRTSHLASAFRTYSLAYEAARKNGAVLAMPRTRYQRGHHRGAAGGLATAHRIAREVRDLCIRAKEKPAARYRLLARGDTPVRPR